MINNYNNNNNYNNYIPLQYSYKLSNLIKGNVFFKREDMNVTRSFKIRGCSYKINKLSKQ